jgi:ubiquinone/menaquinone biosynthesis C-methylase UbiE
MPTLTPERIFLTINAYQQTAALRAAVGLDLFTAIGEGHTNPPALARHTGAAERGLRILSDFLVICGLLSKDKDHYSLTPESAAFLDRRSPACMAGAIRFLNSPLLLDSFEKLPEAVRKGGTAVGPGGSMAPEHPAWLEFARSMVPMMIPPAAAISKIANNPSPKPIKVLDLAAGHGIFGITIARDNPQAQVVACDWAPVLEVAKENARAHGVDGRFSTLPGNAFEVDFGEGYDLVLLTNFLHHFDMPTCDRLLAKVHRCLRLKGRAITLEMVPNEDRVSPPAAAAFSLIMLATTEAGDAYTFAQYDTMFRNAGFSTTELHPLETSPQQLLVSVK